MKLEKWISLIVAAALAFLLSFGAVGCLVTAFDLKAGMGTVCLGCALFTLGGCACWLLKRGDAVIACVFALVLGYLWRRGTLVSSFAALAYEITCHYDGGYGWGILGRAGGSVMPAVLIAGSLIALCTVRTVCRRDTALPALTLALLPLLLCVVVTDTVPGEGYLFLLLMGLILLLLTNNLRRSSAQQANTLTAMAVLPLAIVLGILFWTIPKDGYVNRTEELQDSLIMWAAGIPELWDKLTADEDTIAANDDRLQQVDLSSQGPRKQYTYAVMDVWSDVGGTLYLREQDYDSYSGTGWSNTARRSEEFSRSEDLAWISAGRVAVTTRRSRNVLYYPYYPEEGLTLAGGCVANTEEITAYEVERYLLPPDWRQLVSGENAGGEQPRLPVGNAPAVNKQRYGKLPAATQEWAEQLLETILTDEISATEKADAIAAYVRNSARYDLDTPKMDDNAEDFTIWFLEESDTGYCVHFATAAAVLLRAAGVESRYVTGYMAWAQAGETVTVSAAESHAWVEYYEPLLGVWIVLEATPAVEGNTGDPGETTGATEPDASGETGESPTDGTGDTEEQTPTGTTEVSGAAGTEGTDGTGEDTGEEKRRSMGGWLLLLIPGVIWIQREIRMALRRRNMRQKNPNRRALALWRETVLMASALKQRPPAELEQLAQKAKYSQHTLTAQELMVFDGWLRDAKRRLREEPWHRQLLWRCLYAI